LKVFEVEFEFGSALFKDGGLAALQRPAFDRHLRTSGQWLDADGFVVKVVEPALEGFDFGFAHLGGAFVPEEEAHEARREVDRVAALGLDVDEEVAAEQGLVDPLRAVAPAAFDALRGAVDFVALLAQAVGQLFFPAGLCVNHQPSSAVGRGLASDLFLAAGYWLNQ